MCGTVARENFFLSKTVQNKLITAERNNMHIYDKKHNKFKDMPCRTEIG